MISYFYKLTKKSPRLFHFFSAFFGKEHNIKIINWFSVKISNQNKTINFFLNFPFVFLGFIKESKKKLYNMFSIIFLTHKFHNLIFLGMPPYPQIYKYLEELGRRFASGLDVLRGVNPSFNPFSSYQRELHPSEFNNFTDNMVVRFSRIFNSLNKIEAKMPLPITEAAALLLTTFRNKVPKYLLVGSIANPQILSSNMI